METFRRSCLVVLFLAACGSNGGTGTGDGGTDAGGPTGPSPGVCDPAPGQTGNALHVGAYCTAGANQCVVYGGNLACAIDLDPKQGNDACILIGCAQNGDCGAGACCTGDPSNPIHACVSQGCLTDGGTCPPTPGGSDGGSDGG